MSGIGSPFPAPAEDSGTLVGLFYYFRTDIFSPPHATLSFLAVQYAVAMGLRVVAIDTGAEKRALCLSLGAEAWIDFRQSTNLIADVRAATGGGAHAAIVASGANEAYAQAAAYLRTRGYLMVVGLSKGTQVQVPVILTSALVRTILLKFASSIPNERDCALRD